MLCKKCLIENEDWRDVCKECGTPLADEGAPLAVLIAYVFLMLLGILSAITGVNVLTGNSVVQNKATVIIFFAPLILAILLGYLLFVKGIMKSLKRG
jgi:uncharacterized protein (DUF983 family)